MPRQKLSVSDCQRAPEMILLVRHFKRRRDANVRESEDERGGGEKTRSHDAANCANVITFPAASRITVSVDP
jgi:hypothetical protein